MPWCPKCKTEYVEGVAVCADCNTELVDELPEETDADAPIILYHTETEETAVKIATYLRYQGLETPIVEKDASGFDLVLAEFERASAEKILASFASMEEIGDTDLSELVPGIEQQLEEIESEEANQMLSELRTEASSVYVKKKDKYSDLKFSGISFLIFGIAGLGFVMANGLEWIHFLNPFSTIIMTIVFSLFIVVGITSLIRAGKLKNMVTEEARMTDEVTDWIEENITDELIESLLDDSLSEEDNYFSVQEVLCQKVSEQFPFFSKGYTEELMDDRYNEYCEERRD